MPNDERYLDELYMEIDGCPDPGEIQLPESEGLPPALSVTAPAIMDEHPDLSHDALALALSDAGWCHYARYVNKWGKWLFWTGTRWELDDKLLHYTGVREFLRSYAARLLDDGERRAGIESDSGKAKQIKEWARSNAKAMRMATAVNSVEAVARSNRDLIAVPDQFDADLMLLGTPGGTVDLRTGYLYADAQPEDYITKHCAIAPAEPGTDAPIWQWFLARTFNGDTKLIKYLQRVAGYALTGHTSEHKLFFLYGTGSNGKSVYLNTLFGIIGDYAKRAAAATFLDSAGERHPTDLAGLHGARFVAGSELPAGKAWNETIIKDLTGGDTITARFMRQDYFDYEPQFTLFIAGNHQPSFRGIDEAIRRRVVLIPFTQTIPAEERDPELPEKLKAEWPAILRWMIEGAVQWKRDGLQAPASVEAASTEYLDAEDSIGEFIDDHLILDTAGKVSTAAMYARFQAWQEESGIRQTWTKTAMTKALKERGLDTGRLSGGARGFINVTLAATAEETARAYSEA